MKLVESTWSLPYILFAGYLFYLFICYICIIRNGILARRAYIIWSTMSVINLHCKWQFCKANSELRVRVMSHFSHWNFRIESNLLSFCCANNNNACAMCVLHCHRTNRFGCDRFSFVIGNNVCIWWCKRPPYSQAAHRFHVQWSVWKSKNHRTPCVGRCNQVQCKNRMNLSNIFLCMVHRSIEYIPYSQIKLKCTSCEQIICEMIFSHDWFPLEQ